MNLGSILQNLLGTPQVPSSLRDSGFYFVDREADVCLTSRLLGDLGRSSTDWAEGLIDTVHPEDREAFGEQWRRVFEGADDNYHFECRVRDPRNGWRWVQSHGVVLRRTNGKATVFAGLDQDVTEPKTAEAIIRQQFVDLERVFSQSESLRLASRLAHVSLDLRTNLQVVLDHAHNLIAFDRAVVSQLVGDGLRELCSVGEANEPGRTAEHPVWSVVETKTPELRDGAPEDPYRSWLGVPLVLGARTLGVVEFWHREPGAFAADQVWPAMGFADSLAETISRAQVYEGLRDDVQTDPLTGLLSRRHLEAAGPQRFDACVRDHQPVALLLLDIDRFKQINDAHGHLVGDAVLMSIAQLCRSVLRQGDLFFRYGGEEFVALLPNTESEVALRVAQRLGEITAAARFRGIDDAVTTSIGVATVEPGQRVGFSEALDEADRQMYRAKTAGRNRVSVSDRWVR